MIKKKIYIYSDTPSINFQNEKLFPKKFKLFNKLTYLNTSKIIFGKKKLESFFKSAPRGEIPQNTIYFESYEKLNIFLQALKETDILIFINKSSSIKEKNFDDKRLFKNLRCKKIWIEHSPWLSSNFKKIFFFNFLRTIKYKLSKKLYISQLKNLSVDYLISFGEKNRDRIKKNLDDRIQYLDYPSLWIEPNLRLPYKNLITYVDEGLSYSPDQFLFNSPSKKIKDIKNYLLKLNKFFSIIEKKYKRKIIICCSKKMKYKNNVFNGRKIIYGKTLEYITKSKLVICHNSDALFQAIYSYSPVLLIQSREFSYKKNLKIFYKSINLFNKKSYFLEDYVYNKIIIDTSLDKSFYRKILNDYFISKNQIKQNFHEKFTSDLKKLIL